ncbi:DNase I-like protein [Parathielavia appendiculata]|uniref:DNase I-like protein n=1 Tax=Parathielavia appendiculata TaxID=2587402 RepID=A0AAN6Z1Q7_9PEZI|nr:DNase I-like protein [Parathielavia appendiculata]
MARGDISPPPVKRRKVAVAEPCMPSPRPSSTAESTDVASADHRRPGRTIRIFSWNINGIGPYLPPQTTKITSFFKPSDPNQPLPQLKTDGLRIFLSRHGWPEVLFLQELKVQQGDTKTLAALLSSLNTPLNHDDELTDSRTYTLDAVLPRDKYNARGFGGKLYGVGTIVRTDFARSHVALVRSADWDLEGRATPNHTVHTPLALINVYAVNGTSAPYRDPRTGRPTSRTRHDHKLAFHTYLRDECLTLERRGFGVVVAGDVNVARGPLDGFPKLRIFPRQHCVNRADFNGKFFGAVDNRRAMAYYPCGCLDAVDVFRVVHRHERRYTYYPRTREWGTSCDRVDMVFVSRWLWEAGKVVGTGILDTPQERGLSDHVPIWVEIALEGRNGHFPMPSPHAIKSSAKCCTRLKSEITAPNLRCVTKPRVPCALPLRL